MIPAANTSPYCECDRVLRLSPDDLRNHPPRLHERDCYAYTPTPLYDDPEHQARIAKLARQRIGRIAIANSDSGWDAYTHVAIDQAHRAVMELTPQKPV
jgi:hypothetical protein